MANAKAKSKPQPKTARATKAELSQAVLSPVSKVLDTTSPTLQQGHIYHKCMIAYSGKVGAFTHEQKQWQLG